jgi:hypothetical protein
MHGFMSVVGGVLRVVGLWLSLIAAAYFSCGIRVIDFNAAMERCTSDC